MTPEDFSAHHAAMSAEQKLSCLVEVLTGPAGCAWDQRQTPHSLIDFVIDEAHELKAALAAGERADIASELGDLLFTVEFLTQSLNGSPGREEAADRLVDKMIRRHPHVFAGRSFADEDELKRNWEAEKQKEGGSRQRFDDDLPPSLPALEKAWKVLGRAANAGFRYGSVEDAMDKVWEEMLELEHAVLEGRSRELSEELGDLMLSLVTLAKMSGIKPAEALSGATRKLCDRLRRLEGEAGRPLSSIPRADLAELYARSHEQKRIFFGYCSVSPWPRPVRKAVRRAAHRLGREGLAGSLALREEREASRSRIAEFCGARAGSSVVFVPNVSTAALGVAYCGPWRPGDKLLLGRNEFPANTIPWRTAAKTLGLEVIWFDDDALRREGEAAWVALRQLLEEQRPALLAVSAVSFWSGYRVPLERLGALCREFGVRLYVDAIQALGTVPLEMGTVDYLAGGSHKALLAPEGAGFLLVGEEAGEQWVPRLASWLSLPDPVNFLLSGETDGLPNRADPRPADPTALEGASLNAVGYAGLIASVDLLTEMDVQKIFEKVQALQDPLEEALIRAGWTSLRATTLEERSAILSFEPPPGTSVLEVQARLAARGVDVTVPNGRLRFGFHVFNQAHEVERTVRLFEGS